MPEDAKKLVLMKGGKIDFYLAPVNFHRYISGEGYVAVPHTYIIENDTAPLYRRCDLCKRDAFPGEIMGEYWRNGCGKRRACQSCMLAHESE